MGCCISHPFFEKETVYEVTLDADGVAQRVPKGQGTHFIHISSNNETHLEEKTEQTSRSAVTHDADNSKWPSLSTPPTYNSKVAPVKDEKEKDQEKDQVSS
ncbi:hypothetical protein INT46_008967 [Mucor plumbeus]|uniref:Uncharacterized protein n=1 Tax=Mucor plumbeus TaxID=97098 RepID=A0A8H7UPP0_9FUNG|nr:hypothetical protein INT46_008967 [Mucor plumbeus]